MTSFKILFQVISAPQFM